MLRTQDSRLSTIEQSSRVKSDRLKPFVVDPDMALQDKIKQQCIVAADLGKHCGLAVVDITHRDHFCAWKKSA